ncbi:hypothetical protein [Streptomyces sp. RKAG293]|nr:hypothetical protein [Streptomyces sp. RKAG293]
MHLRNGLIVEALGYSRTTGDVPLAVDALGGSDGRDALDRLAG